MGDEARQAGCSRVRRIGVRLGALGHVEPEALLFCFDAVARGTMAEGAGLDIETVAGAGRCKRCRGTGPNAPRYDLCPSCGTAHIRPTAGEELRLTEIEVE